MDFIKKNFILLLAFFLPVLLISGIALTLYLPSVFLSTDYNFVYATCDYGYNYYSYNCSQFLNSKFSVENGRLLVKEIDPAQDLDRNGVPDINENYVTRIFMHNNGSNESREITLGEAQNLFINNLATSPDGVAVQSGYDRGTDFFIFFDTSSDYGYYLTKGSKRKKLNLVIGDERYYYRDNFKFIGWVE